MKSLIFFQINVNDTLTTLPVETTLTLMDLLVKGGWIMFPIFILSVVTVYVFIERFLTLKKAAKDPLAFIEKVKSMVLQGEINSAKVLCADIGSPFARMIEKGLFKLGNPIENIKGSIEDVGKIEIYKLEKNLPILATISGTAPMIGFLGTVWGMIKAFMAIAQQEGSVSPKLLSSGIYEALITTAFGLIVGIIAYLCYNYLVTRVQNVIQKMEYTAIEFIDLLQQPH